MRTDDFFKVSHLFMFCIGLSLSLSLFFPLCRTEKNRVIAMVTVCYVSSEYKKRKSTKEQDERNQNKSLNQICAKLLLRCWYPSFLSEQEGKRCFNCSGSTNHSCLLLGIVSEMMKKQAVHRTRHRLGT